ncbi:hypothetical protein ACIQPP_20215 [Streptomyces violaceusniger]|uniref:hypothetical protein n=1 Tax=Streptomyces violaceusniger TaxID=68280 RepID=UPI0009C2106C|nr:hypothetical protein [Streptomyces hygroscopicus]AQW50850.1 hypothetical protein SHXM_04313 [Streptomyces hygroscopicus]
MSRVRRVRSALLSAAAIVVSAGIRRWRHRPSRMARLADTQNGGRWQTVTVNRPPTDVSAEALPEPLERYGDRLEIRIRPAPGNCGTELAARTKDQPSRLAIALPGRLAGQDPRPEVRRALREAKSQLEGGTGKAVRAARTKPQS